MYIARLEWRQYVAGTWSSFAVFCVARNSSIAVDMCSVYIATDHQRQPCLLQWTSSTSVLHVGERSGAALCEEVRGKCGDLGMSPHVQARSRHACACAWVIFRHVSVLAMLVVGALHTVALYILRFLVYIQLISYYLLCICHYWMLKYMRQCLYSFLFGFWHAIRAITHTCTCTCITTARIGYVAPIQGVSQQKATRLVAPLAVGTPASSPQLHGSLSAVGVLIYGLARPMRWESWGTALSDGIRISVLGSWPWYSLPTLSNFFITVFADRNEVISGGNFHGEYPVKVGWFTHCCHSYYFCQPCVIQTNVTIWHALSTPWAVHVACACCSHCATREHDVLGAR